MTGLRSGARMGAAAFALGLALAGPQAAGLAVADDSDHEAASVSAADAPASEQGPRSAGRARQGRPAKRDVNAPARGGETVRPAGASAALRTSVIAVPQIKTPAVSARATAAPARTRAAVVAVSSVNATANSVSAGIPGVFGQIVATAREAIGTAEATFFNTLENLLNDLPDNGITQLLEGTLLLVRRSLFNMAPQATGSLPYLSSDGTFNGRIGAVDLEDEPLTYTKVSDPAHGTVQLDANGIYTYTPGADFTGADSFSVVAATTAPGLNVLMPFADNRSLEVTVQVSTSGLAASAPNRMDDVAVYLPEVAGQITLQKFGLLPRYQATVTLTDATSDSLVSWMDSTGDRGEFSLDDMSNLWPQFVSRAAYSGGSMDLGVIFAGEDGSDNALLLSEVTLGTNADGQYVFTGRLSPDSPDRIGSVDRWDVIGVENRARYQNFLTAHGIAGEFIGPSSVVVDFSNGSVLADTASAISYEQDGLYAFDNIQPAGNSGPGAPPTAAPAPGPEVAKSPVTASIPLEQSFVIGRADGSLELWTSGSKQVLQTPTVSGASVVDIVAYDRPLLEADGSTIPGSFTGAIDGTTLTVGALGAGSTVVVGQAITGAGVQPGTVITKFIVPPTGRCTEKNSNGDCIQATGGQGGTDGGLGTYEVSISQTVASTVITQPGTLAKAPGFIVAFSDGTVGLWSATDGWVRLQNSLWGTTKPRQVTAMADFGAGVAVGLDDGSLRMWSGPSGSETALWKNNWTTLRDCAGSTECGPVQNIVTVTDGIVVSNGPGTTAGENLAYYAAPTPDNPSAGPRVVLQGGPADAAVTATTDYTNGVVAGYTDGSVYYWDLRNANQAVTGVELRHGSPMGNPVSAMVSYQRVPSTDVNLVVGFESGQVSLYTGTWQPLHDNSWGSPVRTMTTFSSAAVSAKTGVLVGLGNGSVQLWEGTIKLSAGGQDRWKQLSDPSWGSAVVTLIPFRQDLPDRSGALVDRDGAVVGLADGAVLQWSGVITGTTGQNDWKQIVCKPQGCTPQPTDPEPTLDKEGTLQRAVNYAKGADASAAWGTAGNVGGPGDPLYYGSNLLPPCAKDNSCNGQFVPIAVVVNKTPLEKVWSTSDASLTLDYDVNGIAYGYAFVPDSFWDKLVPGKWSVSALAAVETGPSLTLKLGKDGAINAPRSNLLEWDFSTPGPLGYDRIALGLGIDGEAHAQLFCGASNCPEKLTAHAYLVPGVLINYNTQANPGGVGIGFNYYTDLDYRDFAQITGVSVSTTLTPYATLEYGIFTPEKWWLIGGWSLFKLGVGYENPVTATMSAGQTSGQSGGASLGLSTQGFLSTHAGILESVTPKLTWDNTFQVFDFNNTYTLA